MVLKPGKAYERFNRRGVLLGLVSVGGQPVPIEGESMTVFFFIERVSTMVFLQRVENEMKNEAMAIAFKP